MARARASLKDRPMALFGALGLIVLAAGLAAAWHWGPLKDVAEPRVIARWLDEAADEAWMPVLVAVVYICASLVIFPNTVLCLAVILALGPIAGTAYAFFGSMVAALVGYSIGRSGGEQVKKLRVPAVDKVSAQLRRGGFFQVLALRVLPVAPFSVTNMLSGAARVRLLPFAAATAVGIAPYILAFGAFGRQARRLISNPSLADGLIALGIVVVIALVVWWSRSRAARQK
jgi:phospholipase D1/2